MGRTKKNPTNAKNVALTTGELARNLTGTLREMISVVEIAALNTREPSDRLRDLLGDDAPTHALHVHPNHCNLNREEYTVVMLQLILKDVAQAARKVQLLAHEAPNRPVE